MPKVIERGVSRRLRQVMQLRGMTQVELAKRVVASTGAVSQWLSGAKPPSRDNIKKLAEVLDVDPEWLEYGAGTGPQPDADQERSEYSQSAGWAMRPAPVDGGRDYGNSNVEAFNPDLATMVREALQNVLDVRLDERVGVVFRIIRLRGKDLKDFQQALSWEKLAGHLRAAADVPQRHGRLLRGGLDELERSGEMLLLAVEDSGTSGLIGEEHGEGNFAALARNNLDSSKSTTTAGGSKGLGKGTWWRTSSVFTVIMNSDLSAPTEEGYLDTRIIGRSELPWHQHADASTCAGPGWFGRIHKRNGTTVAESYWNNRALARDLYVERDQDLGPGTTICVLGFHDPSSDEQKDARTLSGDIEKAVVDYFWPAMAEGRLAVTVETWEGRTKKTVVEVDVASHVPMLVDTLQKLRAENLSERLVKAGDVVRREIALSVPARTAADGRHDAFRHDALLLVRRAADDDEGRWLNHLAMYRGPRMVVEYLPLKSAFSGAVPFYAVLLCGEAVTGKPSADDAKADRFLRTAEPPAHDRWTVTAELRNDYARGFKKAIDDLLAGARREIGELVRAPVDHLDDGPNSLKELLNIGEDEPPPPDRPRIHKPSATIDADGRWVVDARIRVQPDSERGWKVQPVVLFDSETGGGVPVAWLELEALSNCSKADGRLFIDRGINEARFRGVTDPESHPIAANETAIRVELRAMERIGDEAHE